MKTLIGKFACFFIGHKWTILWTYYNGKVHCKCKRCEKTKDNYFWEFL